MVSEEIPEFRTLHDPNVPPESPTEVLGLHKLPALLVPGRLHDPEHERFELPQVVVTDRQIDTEAIPRCPVSVPDMLGEAALPQAPGVFRGPPKEIASHSLRA